MKIKIPKPDLKGGLAKLKNLKKEDVITWWKERKERRARILEARRNSAFAKKMQPVYAFMNRFSPFISCASGMHLEFCDRGDLKALCH